MEGDFQIELLLGKSSMTDRKILMNELDGENRRRTVERGSLFDTATVSSHVKVWSGWLRQPTMHMHLAQ